MSPLRTKAPATLPLADLRAMHRGLSGADDKKIRRIASLVESTSGSAMNQALLDPVRARLAQMRPPRPLRLPRLLFMPFDPIIVPANVWRSDEASIPRSALMPICRAIEAALGSDAAPIDAIIAEQDTNNVKAIAEAGAILWPRAAAIASDIRIPTGWRESGLPDLAFQPLVQGLATVWRRAPRLRLLFRDGQIGALMADADAVNEIMAGTPAESAIGCGMVARLILLQSPFAARHLQLFASASVNRNEKVILQKAVSCGVDDALSAMERSGAFSDTVGRATLENVGEQVRALTTLLQRIEEDAIGNAPGPRLKAIRDNLGKACQSRFAKGMQTDVVTALATAATPLDQQQQTILETSARDLRTLESAARGLGGANEYDAQLEAGTQAVAAARQRGVVSRMGEIRLTEIIAGPDAALLLYRR